LLWPPALFVCVAVSNVLIFTYAYVALTDTLPDHNISVYAIPEVCVTELCPITSWPFNCPFLVSANAMPKLEAKTKIQQL